MVKEKALFKFAFFVANAFCLQLVPRPMGAAIFYR